MNKKERRKRKHNSTSCCEFNFKICSTYGYISINNLKYKIHCIPFVYNHRISIFAEKKTAESHKIGSISFILQSEINIQLFSKIFGINYVYLTWGKNEWNVCLQLFFKLELVTTINDLNKNLKSF